MSESSMLSDILPVVEGRLAGADAFFSGVSIDSRRIEPGQLFVALRGDNFDGHDFLEKAAEASAAAALVEREYEEIDIPQVVVADTRMALGLLGGHARDHFAGKVVAVTGSSGKTTVKEMLASILRTALGGEPAVLATRGNLNNELGVPLTLLELDASQQAAVIELGASHPGEIAWTVSLARPQVAIITNAGMAHAGEFGGPQAIVEAKGEIIDGLTAEGALVLNRDDPAFAIWETRAAGRRVVDFALQSPASITARDIQQNTAGAASFTLVCPAGEVRVSLAVLGLHNVSNALAAAAAALELGIDLEQIAGGLASLQPVKGRTVTLQSAAGARLIDDSYNANPASICAAIDILAAFCGQRVLVLGDMGELGDWAEQGHRTVGEHARGRIDALYAFGPLMRHAVDAFGEGGRHFADQSALIAALAAEDGPQTTFLIKGSRSMAMDKVVSALQIPAGDV